MLKNNDVFVLLLILMGMTIVFHYKYVVGILFKKFFIMSSK